jgi:hypothetical protein
MPTWTMSRYALLLIGTVMTGAAAPQPDSSAPPGLPGATAASRAAAMALIQGNHMDAMVPTIIDLFRNTLVAQLTAMTHKPQADVAAIVDEILVPGLKAHAGELSGAVAEIYAADFSADELHALNVFYQTPLGQKMLSLQPLIARQSIAAGQAWGHSVLPDLLRSHAQELRQRGLPI